MLAIRGWHDVLVPSFSHSYLWSGIWMRDSISIMSLLAGSTHTGAANWLTHRTIPTFTSLNRLSLPRSTGSGTATHQDMRSFARGFRGTLQADLSDPRESASRRY